MSILPVYNRANAGDQIFIHRLRRLAAVVAALKSKFPLDVKVYFLIDLQATAVIIVAAHFIFEMAIRDITCVF